jgi:phospholipase C
MNQRWTRMIALLAASALVLLPARPIFADNDNSTTKTPIKHVVVIFQENVSFDHYFGTYPYAQTNIDGSSYFSAPVAGTPRVNDLLSSGLLTQNPNAANPFRIDRSVPNTCDQDHDYGSEQAAADGGLMDKFVTATGCDDPVLGQNSVMGYYDGNTVTALWNYAQHFAMSDNFYGTNFGPSTPGALNVVAGNTFEGTVMNGKSPSGNIAGGSVSGAVIGDPDPYGDTCSASGRAQIRMSGKNVGDLLNAAGITWGAFMGGFADCSHSTTGYTGLNSKDYIPHHAWFQYWASTLNPNHVGPSSPQMIGRTDQANHEYDLSAFWTALSQNNLPAITFLKASAYQDGHAGYSDPLDEQQFLVQVINALEKSPEWKDTAVFITWDDSDGWYDHQMGPIVRQSNTVDDELLGPGNCGTATLLPGETSIQNGRCGLGPRIPLLVISPYARQNYVDHDVTDQSSILRFIEDNWSLGRIGNGSTDAVAGTLDGMFDFSHSSGKLFLDPLTGEITGANP